MTTSSPIRLIPMTSDMIPRPNCDSHSGAATWGENGDGLLLNDPPPCPFSNDTSADASTPQLPTITLGPYDEDYLPREMTFNDNSIISVVSYSILLLVGGLGNLMVFMTLFKNRHRRSRVNRFIMHLCVADMIVTFVMMPLEIGWHATVSWKAGDLTCRALMFFRAFGFYLSSFILISISLDRYFAIAHPLNLNDANHRGTLMLTIAWVFSIIASIPQVGN